MSADPPPPPTPPHPAPLVQLRGLTKRFGSFTAVDRLDLELHPGEIVALLGPNGAGKTTTIRMLMGILAPTTGTATVDGMDCFTERAKVMAQVGYLPDEPSFYEHLKGQEVLSFCGTMRGMSPAVIDERVNELNERLDLGDALGDYAVNYSMGMRKKLALIAAMIHQPRVLILDEPTNGLDPMVTRALLELVRETAASGAAVFYSTHLIEQAERLCHRVGIVHQGALCALGRPTAICAALEVGTLEDAFFAVTGGAQ